MRSVADVQCDVLVVGAGPIGLEVAAALMSDGHAVRVVDEGPVGATIARTFPPRTRFFTSPERLQLRGSAISPLDQEKLTGEEYLAYLRAYVASVGIEVDTFTQVTAGSLDPVVVTARTLAGVERVYRARWLVLATGGTSEPRRLGVEGEDLPHVRHHLGDPHRYAGRRVLIVGGRNSAAESALRCYRVGATVHLCHRGPNIHDRVKFWLKPEVESLMDEGRIIAHMPDAVARITPEAVHLVSGESLEVDDVVLQIGYVQDTSLFELLGLRRGGPDGAPGVDPRTMRSSAPDVFVVGTAIAGTQDRFQVFIENCHDHATRVAAAIAGRPAPRATPSRPLPEV